MNENKVMDTMYTALSIVATGATVYLMIRIIAGPDGMRTLNMRIAKAAEEFCQRQAENWAHLSDRAARFYNSSRDITV